MPTVATKPLSWFKLHPQVRKDFDEADLMRLGESLKVKQLQPVVCLPDARLICGERRFRAARLAGLESLEVKILDEQLSESQIKVYQLTENLQRTDLSGPEKWQGCQELKRINGWSNRELAGHLHLDPSSVTRILSPSDCIPAVQEAFLAGKCGVSDCYAISKLDQSEQAAMLARKLGGATRDDLETAGRKSRNSHASSVKLFRVKAPLPSGVEVVISGKELGLDDVIESLSELLKDAKKANDSRLDVKTWSAVLKDKSKAGAR
jgi:ParB/RepB/Spo0J family partition protein